MTFQFLQSARVFSYPPKFSEHEKKKVIVRGPRTRVIVLLISKFSKARTSLGRPENDIIKSLPHFRYIAMDIESPKTQERSGCGTETASFSYERNVEIYTADDPVAQPRIPSYQPAGRRSLSSTRP